MRIRLLRTVAVVFFASLLVLSVAVAVLTHYYHSSIVATDTFEFRVEPGESLSLIASALAKEKVLTHPHYFKILARVKGASRKIQAGEYQLSPTTTIKQLLRKLITGDVIMREFTIVEGWRFSRIIKEIHDNPYLFHDLKNLNPDEIMARLDTPSRQPEGRFFPETYHFARHSSELSILKDAYNLMVKHLTHQWQRRAKDLPYKSPYEALIVASLIEKETAVNGEKSEVAGVIVRRMGLHMPLQIDPTVIYAMGDDFDGHLTHKDLRVPHEYNTYRFRGLPPTPIAMPGLSSIYAALHPQQGNTLYYVANGDGSHIFSKTFKEHTAAIRAIKRKQREVKHDKQ